MKSLEIAILTLQLFIISISEQKSVIPVSHLKN